MQCLHHLMVSAARDFKKTIPDINNEVAETLSCLLGAISPVGSSRAAIANTSTSSAVVGIEYPPLEQQCLTFLINGLAPSTSQNQGNDSIHSSDVVLNQSNEPNCGKWNIPIIVRLIKGLDRVVPGARLREGKSYLELAIHQLCPMDQYSLILKIEISLPDKQ
ncbi:hypothetical protein P5673_032602 [Acropora cervicornis]|uniref:DUF5641 domain-containing protein n=1 Tax=Acropora cervicornis TaxID=6130 RepID=A0AAD9PQZ5_ACRCE|nr:hypothetical protein P5673_032602 [Acropora cervicornis]